MAQINLPIKQKQTYRHREQFCGCQRLGGGRRMDWEFGVGRCKLIRCKWTMIPNSEENGSENLCILASELYKVITNSNN